MDKASETEHGLRITKWLVSSLMLTNSMFLLLLSPAGLVPVSFLHQSSQPKRQLQGSRSGRSQSPFISCMRSNHQDTARNLHATLLGAQLEGAV